MAPSQHEVRERLARWQRTGDPHDLWPGLEERDFRRAMGDIGGVTRSVLRQADWDDPLDCPFSSPPRALGVAAFTSGMGPLLGYWVETGRICVDSPAATVLAEHLAHGRARAQRLEAALGTVLDAFAARGISVFVLKGMHTAWTYFPEPGTRPASDIDLLVSPANLTEAAAALAALGFHPGASLADESRRDWMPPSASAEPASLEITHRDNPWSVDLHVSLDRTLRFGLRSHFGTTAPGDGMRLERGSRAFYVLPQPLLLAWLAFHAASHLDLGPMVRYVELVLVIRRDFAPHLERWEDFLRLAFRTRAASLGYPALELAEGLAPGSVPQEVHRALKRSAPWMVRRVVSRLRPETAQQLYRMSLDVRIMWLFSLPGVVALVRRGWRPPARGLVDAGRSFLSTQRRRLRLLLRGGLSVRARE